MTTFSAESAIDSISSPRISTPQLAATSRVSLLSRVYIAEGILVFVIGFLAMGFIYGGLVTDKGLPGNDSFYHLKMASMIPEVGLLSEFPWLQHAYFMTEGNGFVSHHYGFHTILLGFIKGCNLFGWDEHAAGRIAMATFMGLNFLVTYLIIVNLRVPGRGVWLFVLLLLPFQFYLRHAFVRAIGPSTLMMLLITLFVIRKQYLLMALSLAAFTHVYLGGVLYGPLIIVGFAAASVIAPREQRRWPIAMISIAMAGWLAGILTFPYREGMIEFLQLQVFGTGLSPDIPVGQEWKPYQNLWWFSTSLSGILLLVHVVIVVLRFRLGPRLTVNESALLWLCLGFFVLTLKARRFIEYWPVFCVVCTAALSSPLITQFANHISMHFQREESRRKKFGKAFVMLALLAVGIVASYAQHEKVAGLPTAIWAAIVLVGWQAWRSIRRMGYAPNIPFTLVGCAALMSVLIPVTSTVGATNLVRAGKAVRCKYDLPAIRELMHHAQANSEPGDVIFTDDWDVFPVFFYHNSHNNYVVGLDPKFTHERRPDLWERFVRITQARVPGTRRIKMKNAEGVEQWKTIRTQLSDIRSVFGARLVITDRRHESMAKALGKSPDLAELIYPLKQEADRPRRPYKLWRILASDHPEQPLDDVLPAESNGLLYLSLVQPAAGCDTPFMVDQSFGGRSIQIGLRRHIRGLVTLPGTAVDFLVPDGFQFFEATVGPEGSSSTTSPLSIEVLVDGSTRADVKQFPESGARIRVEVSPGARITLRTIGESGAGEHGMAWASARFAP